MLRAAAIIRSFKYEWEPSPAGRSGKERENADPENVIIANVF